MEILSIIDLLEEKIEKAPNIPFTNKAIINKEDLLQYIEDLRLKLPEDMKQAKWVKEERKRILAEAQKEAEEIIKNAEEKTNALVNEHEITKKAYNQANEIIAQSQKKARELRLGARQYAEQTLDELDKRLVNLVNIIRQGKLELRQEKPMDSSQGSDGSTDHKD
ncbi:MAG: ATPase [Clostridiaceae bacterium]|nr:ATPase [Clostridiaceae bacterium]